MKSPPTDITEYIASLGTDSPEEIIQKIRVELSDFVENVLLKETTNTLMILERKARHLFQPFIGRLWEKGYKISYLRSLRGQMWIKTHLPEPSGFLKIPRRRPTGLFTIPKQLGLIDLSKRLGLIGLPKRVGILTDCVNTGLEVGQVKTTLADKRCTVERVYSYIANQSGLDRLKKRKIVKKNQIVSKYELYGQEFEDSFKRLQIYYQSRLLPMDIDHPCDLYRVSGDLSPNDFIGIFTDCCEKALGVNTFFSKDENLYLPKNTMSYSMDFGELGLISNAEIVNQVSSLRGPIQIEYPQIRVKARFDAGGYQFSVLTCCPPLNVNLSYFKPNECVMPDFTRCFFRCISSDLPREELVKTLCPLCIENYVGRAILDQISGNFERILGQRFSVQKYDTISS